MMIMILNYGDLLITNLLIIIENEINRDLYLFIYLITVMTKIFYVIFNGELNVIKLENSNLIIKSNLTLNKCGNDKKN